MTHLYMAQEFNGKTIRHFFFRRIGRIVPLYFIILFACFILTTVYGIKTVYNINTSNLLPHIFFLQGTDIFWTIPPEILFYLLFIILWRLRTTHRTFYVLIILLAISVSGHKFLMPIHEMRFNFYAQFLKVYQFFLAGLLVAEWRAKLPFNRMSGANCDFLFLAALCLMFISYPKIHTVVLSPLVGEEVWYTPLPLLATAGVILFAPYSRLGNFLFANSFMRFIGKISFSVYLLHKLVLMNMPSIVKSDMVDLALTFLTVCAVSTLTYYAIEKPWREWFTKFVKLGDTEKASNP